MHTSILEVIAQSDVLYVPSRKQEEGRLAKSYIRLRELGGQYENEYLCTLFGNLATCNFAEGDLVAAALRFQVHEVNGAVYQEVIVNDIVKINK